MTVWVDTPGEDGVATWVEWFFLTLYVRTCFFIGYICTGVGRAGVGGDFEMDLGLFRVMFSPRDERDEQEPK